MCKKKKIEIKLRKSTKKDDTKSTKNVDTKSNKKVDTKSNKLILKNTLLNFFIAPLTKLVNLKISFYWIQIIAKSYVHISLNLTEV